MNANIKELKPLPTGLPHIAYVLLWYPLFTQPFIFREIECLRQIMPLKVYTLYGQNLRHCSQEMKNFQVDVDNYGIKKILSIFSETIKSYVKNPSLTWRLFKYCCLRKWPNIEVMCENLWAFHVGISLGQKFKEDGIDIVYAPWPRGAATAAWVGATLAGLPFAIAARGDNLNPADPDLGDKLKSAVFVRANNLADKKRIEAFDKGQAAGKTCLIYNNLTLKTPEGECKARKRRNTHPRILALGRFDVTKGFDVLIRACAILKRANFKFNLTLAGGGGKVMGLGNLENKLISLRKEMCLESEIRMPGLISHDELPKIMSEHDIFAAPCVVHTSGRRDGIPNTVIEAMSCGLPVVSTDVNALPEIVRNHETGLTVPQNDPDALAKAIIWLTEHPEKAQTYGENGIRLVKELFDGETNSHLFSKIFVDSYQKWKNQKNNMESEKCVA